MKRKLMLVLSVVLTVCLCFTLTACIIMPDENDKEQKLDSPTDITIQNVTENSVFIFDVLYGEEGGGDTEISIDGTAWVDFDNREGYTFDGLTPNTEYTVYARQKGYGDYKSSDIYTKKVTTLRSVTTRIPENVTAIIYHGEVTLNGVTDEMEISYDNGETYTSNKTFTYADKGEKLVFVRYKETSDNLAGADLKIKVVYNDFAGGSGIEADPYLIENFEQLMAINDIEVPAVYKLNDDISFPENPVTDIIVFSGKFDGNNKKFIAPRFDYSANGHYNAYGGIFHTNGRETEICNLTVENAEITTHASNFVHGLLINSAKEISNCKISGKMIVSIMDSRTYQVGGLCGQINDDNSKINGCSVNVTVETAGTEDSPTGLTIGGLVGKISGNCTIENSNANITSLLGSLKFYKAYAGGLVGSVEEADLVTISKSWAETNLNILAISCFSGGIAGPAPNTDITNCYAKGNIVASGRTISSASQCVAGGIAAGVIGNGEFTGSITNCYSAVNFTLDKTQSNIVAAGIICNAIGTADKKIENCLYVGKITTNGFSTNAVYTYAIAFNTSGYTVVNNYVAESSAEGLTNDNVTPVAEEDYLTSSWFSQTLKLDETVWNLKDGELPVIK